jgi:hypothetical protein
MYTKGYPIAHSRNGFRGVQIQLPSAIFTFLFVDQLTARIRCIHRVLNVLMSEKIYGAYVKLPTSSYLVPDEVRDSLDFWPFFEDCIGAIDGTHIPAFVPEEMRTRFRDCKGQVSINVLVACSFGMEFLYILPGWEGSTADSRVFDNARNLDFGIPDGHYYLADARYANSDVLLVPYRRVRYHLKEWGSTTYRHVLLIIT